MRFIVISIIIGYDHTCGRRIIRMQNYKVFFDFYPPPLLIFANKNQTNDHYVKHLYLSTNTPASSTTSHRHTFIHRHMHLKDRLQTIFPTTILVNVC